MKKIIICIFVVLLSVMGVFSIYKLNNKNIFENKKISEIVESDYIIDLDKDVENYKKKDIQDVDISTKPKVKEKVESITEKKSEKKEEPKTSSNKAEPTTKPNTEIKKNDNTTKTTVSSNNNSNTTTEPSKAKPIWEQLGMTEYQYYNEPMYKWEHVDFSVEKYGSEAAARKACAEYGDKYEPYLNGEVLYDCSTVTTASGKYLGEWFHTEQLTR